MATRSMVLTNLLTEQQLRSDIEDRLTDKGGEQQEKGEMNGVQHGRVYTNICTQTASGSAVGLRELTLGLRNNLER